MNRILVLARRDWLHPRAAAEEHYVHQVFSRIARQGAYVALVTGKPLLLPWSSSRAGRLLEQTDDIHIARLGVGPFRRFMLGLFLSRLKNRSGDTLPFDVVVDCVQGKPFPVTDYVDLPVVPLVFDLARGFAASDEPPGPLIATTPHAREALEGAGFPSEHIVYVPFGRDTAAEGTRVWKASGSTTWDGSARLAKAVLENLAHEV